MAAESDDLAAREAERAGAEAARIGGDPGNAPQWEAAEQPVREAGGGEAEGFEEAERALIEHAQHGDPARSPEDDRFTAEREAERSGAQYAEVDQVQASERRGIREDAARERPDEIAGTPAGTENEAGG